MSVRPLGKGFQCDFYDGLKVRVRRVFPTKRDAVAYEGKIKVSILENRYFDIKQDAFQTFKELAGWYLSLEDAKRKKSYGRDQRSVGKLTAFFGSRLIREITPSLISGYQKKRLDEKSYRKHPTRPATVNREIACLRTMFNKAIKDGKLDKNPIRGVKLLKEENVRERILSSEELERYKKSCPPWYLPIAMTAYHTAMRKGEIVNLSPSKVDLREGFIRLKAEDTKTGHGRVIPIDPGLMEILKQSLKVRPLNFDRVFHRNGKPINSEHIRWVHQSVCKDAGISDFTFHDFRHTAINNWRREGHDYFKIMAASGHKTISVFRRYNLVDECELRTLVESKGDKRNTTSL
jgi:integrase